MVGFVESATSGCSAWLLLHSLPVDERGDRLARPGLSNDAIQRKDRVRSDKTRRRLIGNINKIEPRFGSAMMAYAFYRSQALQGFSVRRRCTRAQQSGRDELDCIDAVCSGVHTQPSVCAYEGKPFRTWS
ncbi:MULTISPECIES: hypothetical protein [unclassified Mesorhizobium]|uniref:hypothetical protein n=1 Tax=unclassified Mesorhizobium TaxID=325217 RepID=UPI003338F7EA